MARAAPLLSNFNAGELSPLLDGRSDLDFYRNGCSVLENCIPTVQGPAKIRGGLAFADYTLYQDTKSWLARFEFNYEQSYLLEFNHDRVGFLANRARVVISKAVSNCVNNGGICRLTVTAHGFVTGLYVVTAGIGGVPNANGTYYAEVIDANTIDLPGAAFSGAYTAGGTMTGAYSIATPYTAASLANADGSCALSRVQIGDIVYLAGGGAPPQKLSRTAATSWSIAEFRPDDGPFMDPNTDETLTVYASGQTGSVTLTASAALFTADHVGALIRLEVKDFEDLPPWAPEIETATNSLRRSDGKTYKKTAAMGGSSRTGTVPPTHTKGLASDGSGGANSASQQNGAEWEYQDPGYGVARITGYTNATTVTATVLSQLPYHVVGSGYATWRWRFGAWGDHNEYPTRVTLFRDRLVFSGVRHVWMSQAGAYDKFAPDEYGQQTAVSGITIRPASTDNNAIRWMEASDVLLVGTASTEFAVGEITTVDPLGPANIKADPQTRDGGRAVTPVRIGDDTLFVQRAGRELRRIGVAEDRFKYRTSDLTRRAEHITQSGIIDMAYQHTPDSVVWAVRADGVLLGFTHERDQEVLGWHRHGVSAGSVESVQIIPSPDGLRDDVFVSVLRDFGRRSIEWLTPGHEDGADPQAAVHLDGSVTYDGKVNATLTPGTGATTDELAGVTFTAGASVFQSTDVGRFIHYRYQDADGVYHTAKAEITGYTSGTAVTATIRNPFPSTVQIAANAWRLTVTQITSFIPTRLLTATVRLICDGANAGDAPISAAALTLPQPAGLVHIGIPFTARGRTMRMEGGASDGTSQGRTKRIAKVVFRVKDTASLKVGPDFDSLRELIDRDSTDSMDEPMPLSSGDHLVEWDGGYETDGYICFQADSSLPATVVGIFPRFSTSEG